MDKHQDDIVLDSSESEFKCKGPYGLEIFNGATGQQRNAQYCRVYRAIDCFKIEIGDMAISVSEDVATKLLNHITCSETKALSELDEFYLSSRNYCDINEDISKEWHCYPSVKGSDVSFFIDEDDEDNDVDSENEVLVLSSYKEHVRYLRKDVAVFSCNGRFYIGYPFQATEISEDQYDVLKFSNRASSITTEETAGFGKMDSFTLSGAPAQI
ncbi:hypothetical protein BIT28_07600 [Photobacterium proteolyticum]|uniref:Uncharacterized protein n=1 Tax=Photobacterium proteolyticum TaxID=1903952 RepID=A0A1Q9G6C7_9GAMM|nr:hypothetical protein [Photobacterium proteolyticum]OLQ69836.1 hypothetical protein BIT28_07600 [Photobacterium proteolyticum]